MKALKIEELLVDKTLRDLTEQNTFETDQLNSLITNTN